MSGETSLQLLQRSGWRKEPKSHGWKECVELRNLLQSVTFERMRGAVRKDGDHRGLGVGSVYNKHQSKEQREREAIIRVFKENQEEERVTYVVTNLKHFGDWVKWEAALQLDRRWHSLLAYQTDNQLKFHLLATEDQFPTPSRLCMWGQGDGLCPLCLPHGVKKKASLLHILCDCTHAMKEDKMARQSGHKGHIGRITWRHDSIMFAIFRGVLRTVNRFKKAQQEGRLGVSEVKDHSTIQFRTGANVKYKHLVRVPEVRKVLAGAVDWKLRFDINAPEFGQCKERPFPEEIMPFPGSRPDGVIWSCSIKTVIWIELTSPWEDNMTVRHHEKKARYNQLKIDCELNGWTVHPLCVEVGCRGSCGQSYEWMSKVLGFTKEERRDVKYELEKTAHHCSHAIVAARFIAEWPPRPLLDVSTWQ